MRCTHRCRVALELVCERKEFPLTSALTRWALQSKFNRSVPSRRRGATDLRPAFRRIVPHRCTTSLAAVHVRVYSMDHQVQRAPRRHCARLCIVANVYALMDAALPLGAHLTQDNAPHLMRLRLMQCDTYAVHAACPCRSCSLRTFTLHLCCGVSVLQVGCTGAACNAIPFAHFPPAVVDLAVAYIAPSPPPTPVAAATVSSAFLVPHLLRTRTQVCARGRAAERGRMSRHGWREAGLA
ncbi:hypothetical protein GGX14DRAFT_577069 [Mycena pura]|uniref:Uncharacterized protein n=1 Tax=Mycena pura TaxID=153505 RepID=A0AAD6Y2L2_9AGAR|nr:hypothetical protein GGX14DRAFT_577069 [Mycena pura]